MCFLNNRKIVNGECMYVYVYMHVYIFILFS